MLLSDENDLLLCEGHGSGIALHAYFNIPNLLRDSDREEEITKEPDSSRTISYIQKDSFPGDELWKTYLPKHTYQTGQLPPRIVVATTSNHAGPYTRNYQLPIRYTSHWLDVNETVQYLRSTDTTPLPPISRNHHRIAWDTTIGPKKETHSSAGYRVLWLDAHLPRDAYPDTPPTTKLHFYTLAAPASDDDDNPQSAEYPEFAAEGNIDISMIDLWTVIHMDFCDEASILSAVTATPDSAIKQIHFFDL